MARRGKASEGSDLNPPPKTWLARYRREIPIDQDVFAAGAGLKLRTLQRLESGEVENPPIRYLVSCAVALGLDDWQLLLEDEWTQPLPGAHQVRRTVRERARPFRAR